MSDERLLSVVRRRPATPAGALVLLHGRGTDETDLAPLLDELDPQGRLVEVTLRGAPATRAEWLPLVRAGRAWAPGSRDLPRHL